jgi:hypothetical protein
MTLIHHWELDEETGETIIIDSASSSPSASYGEYSDPSNGVLSVSSPIVTGIYLKGGEYITQNETLLSDYPITMSAWVRTSMSTGLNGCIFALVNKTDNKQIGIEMDDTGVAVYRVKVGIGAAVSVFHQTTINDDKWHHICSVSLNSSNHTLYTDGVVTSSPSTSTKEWTENLDYWAIGVRYTSSPLSFYEGDIDDVRLYDEALTAGQVKNLWHSGVRSWNDQISPFLLAKIKMSGGMQE